jgi:predicted small secreted protein
MKKSVKGFGIIAFAALIVFVIAGCNWENTVGYDIDVYELTTSLKDYYEKEGKSKEATLEGAIESTNVFRGRESNWVADETDLRDFLYLYLDKKATDEELDAIMQIVTNQAEYLDWYVKEGETIAYFVYIQNHDYGK